MKTLLYRMFFLHYLGIEQNIQKYFCKIFKGNSEVQNCRGILCKLTLPNQETETGILTSYSENLNNKADTVNLHYQIGANIKVDLGQPFIVIPNDNKTFCFIKLTSEFTPNTPDPLLIVKLSQEDYPLIYFLKKDSGNYEIQEIEQKEILDQSSGNLKCYLNKKHNFNNIEPFIFNENGNIVGILLPQKLTNIHNSNKFLEENDKNFNKYQCVLIKSIEETIIDKILRNNYLTLISGMNKINLSRNNL